MTTVHYCWDTPEDNIIREVDNSGNVIVDYITQPTFYGRQISEVRNGNCQYQHYDGLGSTLALTDDDAAVTDTFSYNAFGESVGRTGTTQTPSQYCGEYGYRKHEEAEGFYIRARWLSPQLGIWRSQDPLVTSVYPLLSTNQYWYSYNRPTRFIDASGLEVDFEKTCCKASMTWSPAFVEGFKYHLCIEIEIPTIIDAGCKTERTECHTW